VIRKVCCGDAREAAGVIAAATAGKSFADFDGDIVLR
jgi:hypothetical protein